MDQEYLRQQGKLGLKKQEAEKMKLRFDGHARTIRSLLDPTERNPARIKTDMLLEAAFELDKTRTDYLALVAEITEINEYLGRG